MEFDLASVSTRILECAQCHEPVAGDGATARVELRCGYCGFDDVRELVVTRQGAADGDVAYRDRRNGKRTQVRVRLESRPEGIAKGNERAQYLALKGAPLSDDADEAARIDREYRLVWLASTIAAQAIAKREFVRARAIYETTLEMVRTPAYHGMLLARLARLAARSNAPALAERWLTAAPRGLRIPEVDSDLRVADAMRLRALGDHRGVLDVLGDRDVADATSGPSRYIALVLRVDAYENLGDAKKALSFWRQATRSAPLKVGAVAGQLGLAEKTRRVSSRRALAAIPIAVAAIWVVFTSIIHILDGDTVGGGVRFVAAIVCLLVLTLPRRG